MSVKAQQVFNVIETAAPLCIAEPWDNVGLQIGSYHQEVSRILLTLDVTNEVVEEAIERGADCIISHHPLLFGGIKKICFDQYKGAMIKQLIQNDICVYSAHTNLDFSDSGLNCFMSKVLGLKNVESLKTDSDLHGYGCVGEIEPVTSEIFIELLKTKLEVSALKMTRAVSDRVEKVAICTGSGSEFMNAAKKTGADVFVTGDLKYHDAQHAYENGIWVIDAGHFGTEKKVVDLLKEILESSIVLKTIDIIVSEKNQDFLIVC